LFPSDSGGLQIATSTPLVKSFLRNFGKGSLVRSPGQALVLAVGSRWPCHKTCWPLKT
jgi:hypothetical protein